MNHLPPWEQLVAAARRAPSPPESAPPGFATRIAARGLQVRRESGDVFAFLGFRALALALVVMITTAAVSYPLLAGGTTPGDDDNDPVAELVARL